MPVINVNRMIYLDGGGVMSKAQLCLYVHICVKCTRSGA
jgi:hypothetical protein